MVRKASISICMTSMSCSNRLKKLCVVSEMFWCCVIDFRFAFLNHRDENMLYNMMLVICLLTFFMAAIVLILLFVSPKNCFGIDSLLTKGIVD